MDTVARSVDRSSSQRRDFYTKVLDQRKSPIRGLWQRYGNFYGRLSVTDPQTGKKTVRWIRLQTVTGGQSVDVKSVAEARAVLRRLKIQREDKNLPELGRKPLFKDFAAKYLDHFGHTPGAKRASTLAVERIHIGHWSRFLGTKRLDQITLPLVRNFIAKRQTEGWHARTVNLSLTVLRNVLRHAIEARLLNRLPTEGLRMLKVIRAERRLISLAEIERLCQAAGGLQNGQQFVDYVRLMGFCGARRNESLRLRWADVDWDRRQLLIGADGQTKSGKSRWVDFNSRLETHLRDMVTRRVPDSDWLFPSPRRGEHDLPAKTFMESLRLARKAAGMPKFGFHDLRHYFISYAVMSGVDYLTIAKWVGHSDGGILIGKVYGHLNAEHAQAQARRMTFESHPQGSAEQ